MEARPDVGPSQPSGSGVGGVECLLDGVAERAEDVIGEREDEFVLGGEVIQQPTLGDARLPGDLIQGRG